ncbi:igLON family member 5 [Chanos chanos]|uniref:IgLON family member 5 n=1 Tax=Chanos chanos TaxID=29144 RepID=A0A6J2W4M7_CHACN|nr:igLON family member 5 [Chanos chanos]
MSYRTAQRNERSSRLDGFELEDLYALQESLQSSTSAQAAEFGHLPDNITVLEGESVILRCKIDEEVTHKAWLNRSNILFTGTDKWSLDPRVSLANSNDSDFSIQIDRVAVADEGPYTCSFQARNQPRTAHVYLIVQVPAKIVNISQDVSVNEGGNVNLFCLAVGRPEPTVTWKDFKYGLLSEGEFLDITEIKRHQGEEFECITNNGVAAPDTRRVKVTVNYPPTITDVKNMPAQLGKSAILRCEAMAVPTATFEWYRDDRRPVESDNTLTIKNEKTRSLLVFSNVTDKHFGNYTCFASNRLGASNASMLLFRPGAVYGGGVGLSAGVSGLGIWFGLSVSFLTKV